MQSFYKQITELWYILTCYATKNVFGTSWQKKQQLQTYERFASVNGMTSEQWALVERI